MIDILSFNKSLKATWIKKYLDTENGGSWKLFLHVRKPSPSGIVYFHSCSPAGSLRKTLGLLRRTLLWV